MKVCVDPFHICKRHFLPQDHLVESANEECIEKASVEDSQAYHSADEFEVIEMLRVDSGVRVDLQGIVIVSGVFKEAVERVEHFM